MTYLDYRRRQEQIDLAAQRAKTATGATRAVLTAIYHDEALALMREAVKRVGDLEEALRVYDQDNALLHRTAGILREGTRPRSFE